MICLILEPLTCSMKIITLLPFIILSCSCFAQEIKVKEKKLLKTYEADSIIIQNEYSSHIFIQLRNESTQKWGLIKQSKDGILSETLPFEYDNIDFRLNNSIFMVVSKAGKEAIFILDKMDKNSKGAFSTDFIYDKLVVIALNGSFDMIYHLAANKNGNWGWIDWKTGEEKTVFTFNSIEDLPIP